MRTILPLAAAVALSACSSEPEMVAADAPPEAASVAIGDLVRDGDPYAPAAPSPAERRAPRAPPSTL